MQRNLLFLFLLWCSAPIRLSAQERSAIGQWQAHLPYTNLIAVVEGGGGIYAASTTAVFRYDPVSEEIDLLNKTNVLNDVGIQGLAWNDELGTLLVYYSNGDIDLVKDGTSWNIGDIKRSSIIGNKGIYSVAMLGTRAYLGCGFGIVVLDLAAREVRETWFIGPSGSQVRVNGIAMTQDSIYAACGTGLFTASRSAANLASFTSWTKRVDMGASLSNGPFNCVTTFGGRLLLNAQRTSGSGGDTLLVLEQNDTWTRFTPLYDRVNRDMKVSADGLFVVIPHGGDIHVYDQQLVEIGFIYGYLGQYCDPSQAIRLFSGFVWVADRSQGLVRAPGGTEATAVLPNGPRTATSWRLASDQGSVYVATGAVTGTWDNTFLKDGVHLFQDGAWKTLERSRYPLMNGVNEFGGALNDPISVAIDPDDPRHAFVGSWDEGLLEIRDGAPVAILNASNSSLSEDVNPYQGRLYVSGLDYDEEGTLWMSNAKSATPIVARTKEGEWHTFDPGSTLGGNALIADILAARNGYKWVIRPRGNGLLVFDSGTSLGNTDDDRYVLVTNQTGRGGLPAPDVYSIAEDREGQVWVGTSRGLALFYSPEVVFSGEEFDAEQILIEQDGNVQILLETEAISAIVVDGANRKWIGTQTSGIYLISADGQEQILHFTAENSPLPSNNIVSVAVDGLTGEVYMATDRGIMSYRGDATEGGDESECVSVFPNPARETYSGPIAITGLVRDSEVKITDVSGNLVFRTTSLGGQAIWDGNDMSGRRAATGVYLVFASDITGTFKCNTKLLLVK
ncbi:MAG: hypothetical protein JNM62_06480 [Flavobacteriales bacterium]|nr:hypothetical protein [Flavobacteriales bacterium]